MSDQLMRDIERAREPYSPDMSDTAVHISLLETERDGLRLMVADLERQLADANGHVSALTAALTTRRSACDEESERADKAEREVDQWVKNSAVAQRRIEALERQIAAANTALENIARECSTFPIKNGLAFRCESLARAALPDRARGPA